MQEKKTQGSENLCSFVTSVFKHWSYNAGMTQSTDDTGLAEERTSTEAAAQREKCRGRTGEHSRDPLSM